MSSGEKESQNQENSEHRNNKVRFSSPSQPIQYNSPEKTKENLAINIDEELARLELETLDDFVNSLEVYENPTISGTETEKSVDKYALQNDLQTFSTTNKSSSTRINKTTGSSETKIDNALEHTARNQSDSGISSTTSTESALNNILISDILDFSHGVPGNRVDMDKNKIQANGSVTQPGPSIGRKHGRNKGASDLSIPGAVVDTSALRSELILAVEQNKYDRVRRILATGVDANAVCDDKGRWPLHIAAFFGFADISKLLLDHGAQKDQPDTALERAPLLYAAATSPETVQLLLNYKVDIHTVNKFGATSLHYAAGSGQSECCRILAAAGCDVNARDKQKMTPLHMAARVDDIWSIEVLLEFGADVHSKDSVGKTALHHAAETSEGMVSDHKKMGATFRRLITAGATINAMDNDGKTALYYAVQTGSPEAVTILQELGAELMDGVSVLVMGRKFPALIRPFLDKCISSNIDNCDPESKHFYIQFDYTCLTFYPKDIMDDKLHTMQHRDETESILQEMGVLHGLTRCKDSSILSHPVCESLLRLKWKKVKWYLYLDMLLFAVFLAFLTAVIFMEYESDSTQNLLQNNITESASTNHDSVDSRTHIHNRSNYYCMDSTRNIVVWVILWVLTACLGIREMVQLLQAPLHYVVQVENMLELVLVFSVAMLSLAECGVQSFVNARDHFAAVCLIVGWTIQVTLYGKIPVFGVYIRMFAAVAVNILKCMFTYLGLLFAFSLTLHFLFRSQKEFDSVGFTFLKTFAMMIGEIELVRTFIENDGNYIVPFTSHLMFALFIIFISVILMCLLVALAVSDIASMQREGEYMQLVQQVKVASQLEDALQHRSLLYPQFGMRDLKALHQRKGVIFPNLKDHGKLGKDALELVITQHTRKMDASNTNVISQQIHSEDNDTVAKIMNQNARNSVEMADDLLQKIKTRMDMYSLEAEKRNDKLYMDFRGSQERGTNSFNREILLIKNQLEDMNTCLREMSIMVKNMSERSTDDSSSETPERQQGRHKRSIDATTVTDFNPTSPEELEVTETSTQSSPEPSTRASRQNTQPPRSGHSPTNNPSPNPNENEENP